MNARSLPRLCFATLTASQVCASAQTPWLDKIDDALAIQNRNGTVRADLSGLIDLEGYYIDQNAPGLLFANKNWLANPRLSLFLDLQLGKHFYSLTQVRADRGFDPGSRPEGNLRLDEYLLRWTPFDDSRLNIQVGKFATVFGEWVGRHDSWQNPFINAPVPYENVTTITDLFAPSSAARFMARRFVPDLKTIWLPVIWGPAYTTGASVFGLVDRFDYAFEFKNASISSRPYAWDPVEVGWENPTISARLGMRPNESWKFGASASHGAYLLPDAIPSLPPGSDLNDFNQTTIGIDASYAWHHWQVWGEAIASRFDVPRVGNVDCASYFIEAKYKFNEHLFGAARWNHQLFNKVTIPGQPAVRWDQDLWRADFALGWRFDRHMQAKLQYSYSHQEGPFQQGEQLACAQFTVKF